MLVSRMTRLRLALTVMLCASAGATHAIGPGGQPVSLQSYSTLPVIGVQVIRQDTNKMDVCGGVLLNPTWALTAASCFIASAGMPNVIIRAVRTIDMFASRDNEQAIRRDQVLVHPGFNPAKDAFDFALIRLDRPFAGSQTIAYARLLSASTDSESYLLVGYGADDRGKIGTLRSITKRKEERAERPHESAEYIGFQQSRADGICGGDLGGPVLVSVNYALHVVALQQSVVPASSSAQPCHGRGLMLRVDAGMDWVASVLGRDVVTATQAASSSAADDPKVVGGMFKP